MDTVLNKQRADSSQRFGHQRIVLDRAFDQVGVYVDQPALQTLFDLMLSSL
jgi:hypothetical protein